MTNFTTNWGGHSGRVSLMHELVIKTSKTTMQKLCAPLLITSHFFILLNIIKQNCQNIWFPGMVTLWQPWSDSQALSWENIKRWDLFSKTGLFLWLKNDKDKKLHKIVDNCCLRWLFLYKRCGNTLIGFECILPQSNTEFHRV